jgi:hypothetical protein
VGLKCLSIVLSTTRLITLKLLLSESGNWSPATWDLSFGLSSSHENRRRETDRNSSADYSRSAVRCHDLDFRLIVKSSSWKDVFLNIPIRMLKDLPQSIPLRTIAVGSMLNGKEVTLPSISLPSILTNQNRIRSQHTEYERNS